LTLSPIGFDWLRYLSKRNLLNMSKRNTPQRRHNILALLNEQGEVSVDELAKRFETSEVTIRKDLAALKATACCFAVTVVRSPCPRSWWPISAAGLQIQTGHCPCCGDTNPRTRADHHRQRQHHRCDDSGTGPTAGPGGDDQLLNVASALSELEHEPVLLMTGGTWDPHSESFQGQVAEQVLRSYDFDQLFIGADGIDLVRGTTTFNELLGLSRVMAEVAREVVVMVESDKIGRKIPNLELPWSSVHTLITDDRLPLEAATRFKPAASR
jgi:hypothetical protein